LSSDVRRDNEKADGGCEITRGRKVWKEREARKEREKGSCVARSEGRHGKMLRRK
jgi:hypothetical protein